MNIDRILYKHQSTTQVNPLHYDSVQDITTSDHKPVWGIWGVKIRPSKDSVPLSGGLFNWEVYLEGLKENPKLYIIHRLENWIAIFSDHVYLWIYNNCKPVWGIWEVKIRHGKDNVPLSGGLFNREVYLEGLKRRSEALHPPSAVKMNCNVQ